MEKKIHMKGIVKGVVFSLVITFLFILAISAFAYFGDVSDRVITIIIFAGLVAGVFTGAFMVSRGADNLKTLHGALVGGIYLLVMIVISLFINHKFAVNAHFLTQCAGCVIAGVLGGVMGR